MSKQVDVDALRHRQAHSRREVAFLTSTTERHVINLVKRNLLVEISVGRRRLIPKWSLDKLLGGEAQANSAEVTEAAA